MPGTDSPALRVLIVDDCPDTRTILRLLLGLWGYEVREAAGGAEALDAARDFLPHVVLLDLVMPRMDGYETARRLRRVPDLGGVLLAAVTGRGWEEDLARCREAGFDRHFLKPFDLPALRRLLDERAASPEPLPA